MLAVMKHPSENELSALSSGLIGILGVGLLLIPVRLNVLDTNTPIFAVLALGIFSFAASLSLQISSILPIQKRRVRLIQNSTIFFLLLFAWLFLRTGHFVETIIIVVAAVMQFILQGNAGERFARLDLLKITFILINLLSGIYLGISGDEYTQVDISLYRMPLTIGLTGSALIGLLTLRQKPSRLNALFLRLMAVPWLVWCAIFTPSLSAANIIPPAVLFMSILFEDFLPWDKIQMDSNNVLGQRILMIACTLEMTALIFLSALMIIFDHSLIIEGSTFLTTRDAALLFFLSISTVVYSAALLVIMTTNGLIVELKEIESNKDEIDRPADLRLMQWNKRLSRYLRPFLQTQEKVQHRLTNQNDQINLLVNQLKTEKKRNNQLILLTELSQQLENQLDQPVAAQLSVNTLERALNCSLATIYIHEADEKEFMLIAAAGPQTMFMPSGFRQATNTGAIGRAVRQRKTQIINDIRNDADYILFKNENNLSAVIIPLISNGHVNGAIVLNSEKTNAFSSIDISLAESVAAELTRAWERSGYHQRLMNLVQAGSQLSAMVEPDATAREVASIAREILQAKFTFVQIQLGQERNFSQSASSGEAPRLLASLEDLNVSEELIRLSSHAVQPFRVRDVRKFASTAHLSIDNTGLRGMLAIPIRWHRISIGTILAFGKKNEVFFNENDQSLAELLSIQAAGAFESTWLQQELRGSLRTTSLLYRLSTQIIQAENLENAALDITQTAHKLAKSSCTGIILLNQKGDIVTELMIDSNGVHRGVEHPMSIIADAMSSGQLIYLSQGHSVTRACLPIQTPIRKYGAVWMDIPENPGSKSPANPNDLQALVNQTAIALERSVLLVESRRQAAEIKSAYDTLENTYDQTLEALMSALDARDRETEGHSARVSHLTAELGKKLNFSREQLKVLERGSLLHDIGKIGISDAILHKPGPLTEEEWVVMRRHPDIGARIVEGIPFLQDTLPLIRHHQERWDGTGYPVGLQGEDIPILARMFAIVDAFDALTSKRPYRKKISAQEAVDYLSEQAGILFDPQIVEVFKSLIAEDPTGTVFVEKS